MQLIQKATKIMSLKFAGGSLMLKSGVKDDEYTEEPVESLEYDELNLDIPAFDTDYFTLPSTELGHGQDTSNFALECWLRSLVDEGLGDLDESGMIRPAPMVSPHIIRAPLRSVRSDKQALRSA